MFFSNLPVFTGLPAQRYLCILLFSLAFSLTAGIISVVIMKLLSGIKSVSVVGFSIAGAVVHNLVQLTVASIIFGRAVWYYLPFLLVSALISGGIIGALSLIIFKRIK